MVLRTEVSPTDVAEGLSTCSNPNPETTVVAICGGSSGTGALVTLQGVSSDDTARIGVGLVGLRAMATNLNG